LKPLSFIIITYNRCNDLLELLENIHTLHEASNLLNDIIVVNNCSTDSYKIVTDYIDKIATLPIQYIEAPSNLGVAKGRNFALQYCKSEIAIMLDDDAVLQNKDCLQNLVEEFENESAENEIAIVSFKVLYYDTLDMQVNALPHKNFKAYSNKSFFETYYFAGGAHAVKMNIMTTLGNYPEDFFYGMEEYDLSYRIIDAGFSIIYSDKIVMLHKESPFGRKSKEEKVRMMWVNKTKVAWRYLPKIYFYSTTIMWSIQFLKESKFSLKGFLEGWKEVFTIRKNNKRNTISKLSLAYLKKVEARLWY
jgi:GT2 family glycosyltransferase